MGSLASSPSKLEHAWPRGWHMAVDPATRVFLDLLRRLRPGDYRKARKEARAQVEELTDNVVPDRPDQLSDLDAILARLDLDRQQPPPE